MSRYAVYKLFDDCEAPYNVEFCGHLVGARVGTSDKNPLLDPTCHDFGGEEGTNGEGYDFACSACGYVCDLAEPRFCPNCGARQRRA